MPLSKMPKKRLVLLIALAVVALALAVVLAITVGLLASGPDCEQVREDVLDEERYERLKELARFTEALAVLEHAHQKYESLAEARKLTEKYTSLPVLQEALAYYRKQATPKPDEKAPLSTAGRILRATYVALQDAPKRLASAMSQGDRGSVARTAKNGADLLTNVAGYLGAGGARRPKAAVDAERQVQAEIDALRTVQYACGHCGDPNADRVPVDPEDWVEYRCDTPRDGCVAREKYSTVKGLGCPGQGADEQLCCPP
jgi:hypothetical protein